MSRRTVNLGETAHSPFNVIRVADDNRAPTLTCKTNEVPVLEVVYLGTVCDFLPGFDESSESRRDLLIITFLVGVEISIEDASGEKR